MHVSSADTDTGRKAEFSLKTLRESDQIDFGLVESLASIVGPSNVISDFDARLEYAQDKLPYAKYRVRSGYVAATVPRAVVRPGNTGEVAALLRLAGREGFHVIPFGSGSGVLGGALPLSREVVLDLRGLDRVIEINATDGTATVQAGLNGGEFEKKLNKAGWTCGHYPQSMLISTVGGWAACRGGGQATSRYGKIEDIVTGMEVVVPDGRIVRVKPAPRRAVGPSVKDLFIGSEGTLGVITEITIRIWKLPEAELAMCCAFPDLDSALHSARQIMQAELRPEIMRVYDAAESEHRNEGLKEFADKPFMGLFAFSGLKPLAEVEKNEALAIIERNGGVVSSDLPFRKWKENRYVSLSDSWSRKGWFMDTIEVTAPWSRVPELYANAAREVRAIHPGIFFGAHWSHAYPDGVCQYMTFRLPPMPDAEALPLHARVWDIVQGMTIDHGGSISHHHGAGVFRNRWMAHEHGNALELIQTIKDALDPQNLMNPGKLGLRAAAGAIELLPVMEDPEV